MTNKPRFDKFQSVAFGLMKSLKQIEQFYQMAFESLDGRYGVPPVEVEFYEYVGLRHTIRIREKRVFVRLSDITKSAPLSVHQALAFILVAKLLKRRIPKKAAEIYRNFAHQPEVTANSQEKRRERGRKVITTAQGKVYDLDKMFLKLKEKYFRNRLRKPVLTWSQRKTYRIFGHHDATHRTVVISKTLDDKTVPRFVVEFVLYHELLHIKHPTQTVNGRRLIHTDAFRRDEARFPRIEAAEKWLSAIAARKRTKRRRT